MSAEVYSRKQKCPLDARIVGWSWVLLALVPLVAGLSYLMDPCDTLVVPQYVLFGVVAVRSQMWAGVYWLITAGLSVVGGYGLTRLRSYGWWLLVVDLFNAGLNAARTPAQVRLLGAVLMVAYLGWAIFRASLYKPFTRPWRRHAEGQ